MFSKLSSVLLSSAVLMSICGSGIILIFLPATPGLLLTALPLSRILCIQRFPPDTLVIPDWKIRLVKTFLPFSCEALVLYRISLGYDSETGVNLHNSLACCNTVLLLRLHTRHQCNWDPPLPY